MRKLLLLATAASAVCFSGAANAVTCVSGTEYYSSGVCTTVYVAGVDPEFSVTQHLDGTISAGLHHDGIGNYDFQDIFYFFTDDNGTGSGSVSTSASFLGDVTDLDFANLDIYTNAVYNGDGTFTGGNHYSFAPNVFAGGLIEFMAGTNIPITALQDNFIVISGASRGNGSYGGQATFVPTVPEPATWAMMLFGFGAVGFGMRRRKKDQVRVRFAF